MAFTEWTEAFSVGVGEIDQQHQRLLVLMNKLHDAAQRSEQLATLASVLDEFELVKHGIDELEDYIVYHFETEERYMLRHAYPQTEQHRSEHQSFSRKIDGFRKHAARPQGRLCPEVAAFCEQWWASHVQGTDRRLGVFLNEKGQK